MAEKSAISAALRRRLFIVQIDVPRDFSKPFLVYATIKPEVKRVFYVTRSYAAAGISRYRLINVAPIIGSLSGTKKFGYPVVQLCRGSNLSVPCFWVHKVILSVPLAWNIFSPWLDLTDDGASALLTSSLQYFHRASVILLISNSRPWTSLLILTVIYSFVGILCIILWLS